MNDSPDVLILGGGVIGLTTAYYLAKERIRVCVVDRGELGKESSWAGAGIITPGHPQRATEPFAQLMALGFTLFPGLAMELKSMTGIDNGFRVCGGVERVADTSPEAIRDWQAQGIIFERLSNQELRKVHPAIGSRFGDGYSLPQTAQVRNPWHMRALIDACRSLGVRLLPTVDFRGLVTSGDRVVSVRTANRDLSAGRFLVAAGAWTSQVLNSLRLNMEVFPIRGQIVLVAAPLGLLRPILFHGKDYLVPRDDGRILIGSTEEDVGFTPGNTPSAVEGLLAMAHDFVPALRQARVEKCWSGFRPATRRGCPYLGAVPGWTNLFVAAGHFRAGIHSSPATGLVLSELLTNRPTSLPLEPFRLPDTATKSP